MPKFVLPDEESWVVPEPWRKGIHPRRGGHPVPWEAAPDPAAVVRDWLSSDRIHRRTAKTTQERAVTYDARLLAEGERYLDALRADAPLPEDITPVAAAVGCTLAPMSYYHGDDVAARSTVDVWIARFGIEFAVRVIGEAAGLVGTPEFWVDDPSKGKTYGDMWRGNDAERVAAVARALRARLSTVDDDSYARACAVLGGYRGTERQRLVASYLVPTQSAWVDEDCAAVVGWLAQRPGRSVEGAFAPLLLCSASSVTHLEQLRGVSAGQHGGDTLGTVLDGVGPAAVPVLMDRSYLETFRACTDSVTYRDPVEIGDPLVKLFGQTPTDEAFRLLCRYTLGVERTRVGVLLKSGAVQRYPVRALRLLAGLAQEPPTEYVRWKDLPPRVANENEPAIYADLFGALLLSEPRLLPAVAAALPDDVRARAEAVVASGGAGVGAGWAALLDRHERARYNRSLDAADDEKRAIGALAAIPTDEAFGMLVDRVDVKYVRPVLLTVAKKNPLRALRVLAGRATDPAGTAAELLRNHVLAHPAVAAQALPELDAEARGRVAAILGVQALTDGTPGSDSTTAGVPSAGDAVDGVQRVTPAVLDGPLRGAAGRAVRVPELPEWAVVLSLPPVRLRDGSGVLSRAAAERLCALLTLSKIGEPHPSVADVRASCEPADLAAFGWGLLEQWRVAGYPSRSGLALQAVAALGDDGSASDLAALFPSWAKGSSMRVRTGMTALAAIGTDVALTQLNRLGRAARTAGFRRMARECLARVAEARGLSPVRLADRIVPGLGLDARGRIGFDYGPRAFTVELDEHLAPIVVDGKGKRLARMPRPAAADDPALAPAAYERFAELKKELKTVAAERIRALEEAMVDGRRWDVAEFRRLLVEHPLMWQLTRRLLWGTFDGDTLTAAFRVAEDRSLADVDDKAFALADDARVGVVHPWQLGDARAQWSTVFEDYEVIQPFAQLGRELHGPAADTTELAEYVDARVQIGRVYALAAKGWDLDEEHDTLLREWTADGRTVEVRLAGGYHPFSGERTTRLRGVRVVVARSTTPASFRDLHPIAYSETMRDIESLRG
ncbi:hypothetical protein Val02_31340 [Virgisporangium aliadipatigenens]|uniref:DUF4132 domain-containing protein n=1 Tax=Virgisporangium aliadipatigenens TaxID=741659 RepID=A0A8J3YLD2_9ACTN|nr:DUF4132 domain-containing protein [Virgisporangium aliadipatigenens]GIJ46248.1 hypothetical protein Val02_31340 [Virgisporangium aliadipatigenens]